MSARVSREGGVMCCDRRASIMRPSASTLAVVVNSEAARAASCTPSQLPKGRQRSPRLRDARDMKFLHVLTAAWSAGSGALSKPACAAA
eukprot:scaffold1964_cov252-Isochrysis_galbana.AAC.14